MHLNNSIDFTLNGTTVRIDGNITYGTNFIYTPFGSKIITGMAAHPIPVTDSNSFYTDFILTIESVPYQDGLNLKNIFSTEFDSIEIVKNGEFVDLGNGMGNPVNDIVLMHNSTKEVFKLKPPRIWYLAIKGRY